MSAQFVIADTHFTHRGMIRFGSATGKPLRPWGRVCGDMSDEEADRRVAEMDEAMVERWNAVVPATGGKVYVLGDVVINRRALAIMDRLNGKKKLIMGNHDIFPLGDYTKHFYDVAAYRVMDDLIMSHIPIHEESLKERWKANVHGHLHSNRVMETITRPATEFPIDGVETVTRIHPRYLCVSAEHTDFAPISMDEVRARIEQQQREAA